MGNTATQDIHAPQRRRFACCLALTVAAFSAGMPGGAAAAASVAFPNKPIRMVVAFAPGGPNDVMARILSARLSVQLGQQVVVDNRAGAGGLIGTDMVAKAPADGYTLLFASAPFAIAPSLYKSIPYDTAKDFTAISKVASSPMILMVPPSARFKSARELFEYARANPAKLNYGSGGVGSTPHFATAYLESATGTKMNHVPYKGGGPALAALMGAEVDILLDSITSTLPFIEQGKVRALASSEKQRSAKLPNVPTMEEAGVSGHAATHWVGVVGPVRLSKDMVERLNGEVVKALAATEVRERLSALGADVVGDAPAAFQTFIQAELARYAKVAREANIEAQ